MPRTFVTPAFADSLFLREHDRGLLGGADALKEGAQGGILGGWDGRGALREAAGEVELAVFDGIGGGVCAEGGIEFDGVGQFVHVEAGGKFDFDRLAVSMRLEHDGVLARRWSGTWIRCGREWRA